MVGVYNSAAAVCGVLLIIFLAYIGTRYISKKYAKMSSGKTIKIMERVSLGQDKMLALVSIGKKAYLLGITSKSVNSLCEFTEDEIPLTPTFSKNDFSALMSENLKKMSFLHFPSKKNKEE